MSSKQFYDTRRMFIEYTKYDHPLSYDEWSNSDPDSKAALLYIEYFDEILTAWYKLSTSYPYMDVDESIETVLQYLVKNVPKIEASPKKYTRSYVYTVAYNCLYCISHDRVGDRYRYFHESSNIIEDDDNKELDLFDTLSDTKDDVDSKYDDDPVREYFWRTIEDSGKDSMSVVMEILTGYQDPDCKVCGPKKAKVMNKLHDELEMYLKYYNNGKEWQ